MQITLAQFEAIDGLNDRLARMGDFMTCADPRGYIRTSNTLMDACIDALGYDHVQSFESAQACAADLLARCLSSAVAVVDEEDFCDCGATIDAGAQLCGACSAEYHAEMADADF